MPFSDIIIILPLTRKVIVIENFDVLGAKAVCGQLRKVFEH